MARKARKEMGNDEIGAVFAPTGFEPPALPKICAPRHRLLNIFYRAADKPLTIVRAPAGCGKSLSTVLWLADCGRAAVWFGLDERDSDPARFYKRFGEGLAALLPESRATANVLSDPAFAVSPVEHALRLTREFVQAWAPCGMSGRTPGRRRSGRTPGRLRPDWTRDTRRPVLVFDDFHLADSGEIRQSLPIVLQELPPFFSVFLLSRDETGEPAGLASDYSPGKGTPLITPLITEADLAFETEEIRAYFAARRVSLSEAEAASLFDLTGGWAMGVNVMAAVGRAALGMQGGRAFDEYINVRIWKKWSRELRDFMRITSVPDEFSIATAELLTGRKDCDSIVEKLRAENLFVISLGNGMYRYQRLFLDFLRGKGRERARIDFSALHKTLAFDSLKKGEDAAALRHALLSADDECITAATGAVFQYSAACTDVSAFTEMFRQHFAGNPAERVNAAALRKHPYLLTLFAWYHYLAGEIRPFMAFLDALYAKLPDIRAGHRAFQEGCAMLATLDPRRPPTGKSGELLAELAAQLAVETQAGTGDRNGQGERSEQDGGSETGPAIQSASLSQNLPFMHRSNRDYSAYVLDVEENMAAFGATFKPYLREDYQAIEALLRAGLAYEQNRLEDALAEAEHAFAAMTESTATELRFSAVMIQAVSLCALGRNSEAQELFADTRRMLEERKAHYLVPNLQAVETKLLLAEGDTAPAANWLNRFLIGQDGPVELYKSPRHFATARACIVMGEKEKAGDILQGLREMGRDFARPLDMAEAGALLALTRYREQKSREAVRLLERAMEIVQPYGFIRVFADEGMALLPLLKKVTARVTKAGYAGTLTPGYVRAVMDETRKAIRGVTQRGNTKWPRSGLAFPESGPGVNLSKRQGEILALLSRGCTQADMVRKTGLSLPTVKTHCAAIYNKLAVNNVRDALARARKLGLL